MAINLTRPKHRSLSNPSLIHFFSSSTTNPNDPSPQNPTNNSQSQSQPQSQTSSFFSDVKSSLKQQQQQQQQQNNPNFPPLRKPTYPSSMSSSSSISSSKVSSLEEIRKNLTEFRRRSAVPNPTETTNPISLQELYKRKVIAKSNESEPNSESSPLKSGGVSGGGGGGGVTLSFTAIRESLRQMRANTASNVEKRDSMSLDSFKNSLRLKPDGSSNVGSTVIGGTDSLPLSVFGKEMRGEGGNKSDAMKTEFVRVYSHKDLGSKLRELRPEGVKEGVRWFSLEELSERLGKLREIEEKETQSNIGGISFKGLRDSLVSLKLSDDEKARKTSSESG